MRIIFLTLFMFLSVHLVAEEQRCFDYMLLEGYENLYTYGMDTTQNWWAITQPFEKQYRLIVNGNQTDVFLDIKQLTFSPDGNKWACFVRDNTQWYFLSNDTSFIIQGNEVGEIVFSPSSNYYVYSYFESNDEYVIFKDKKIRTYQRLPGLYLSYNAERIAWKAARGDGFVMYINGTETEVYDDIKPIGFWSNGKMVYGIKNGDNWEIYRGDELLTETYSNISEAGINLRGNVAGALVTEHSGTKKSLLISDDYYEPLLGNRYNNVFNLRLHPEIAMMAFNADYHGKLLVVMNTAEYSGGSELTGAPQFTHDGEDLFFLGCDLHCFVNINGRKYPMNSEIPIDRTFAKKPGSNTIAYTTSTSMVVRNIENNELYAGMMVDLLISPRYNWRTGTYETLGSIGNRLYLMTCRF